MIDLGLTKLAVIGAVALVVIGPEKLPKVARMAGTLYGRAQRYLHQVKSEVSREIELEELRNLHKDVQDSAQSFKSSVDGFKAGVEDTVSSHLGEVESAWHGETTPMPEPETAFPRDEIERKARDFRRGSRIAREHANTCCPVPRASGSSVPASNPTHPFSDDPRSCGRRNLHFPPGRAA
jgi:sec-independent protein translocase protein TatB